MRNLVHSHIEEIFFMDKEIKKTIKTLEEQVLKDEILATNAAGKIVNIFKERYKS